MGEIRLTCPECGAEYRIAEGAIPMGGRSVECSSCGTVWHQPGIAAPEDGAPAPDLAGAGRLNRPLPESVLSVLREEAELARRQRETAAAAEVATDRPDPGLPRLQPDPAGPGPSAEDWPATTITTPAIEALSGAGLPADAPPAGPAPSRHINTTPTRPAADAPPHQVMEATITRSTPHRAAHPAEDDQPAITVEPVRLATSNYRLGFGLAAGIAAVFLLLYATAPRLADQGAAGAALMEWRTTVDQGRIWLGDRVAGVLDGVLDGVLTGGQDRSQQ